MKKLLKRFKVFRLKNSIIHLEEQIMFFEIPYEIGFKKIEQINKQIKLIQNEK